jgi:hypothetical protein
MSPLDFDERVIVKDTDRTRASGTAGWHGRVVGKSAADATFESRFHSVGINVGTKCKFPGNFDARVDYELLRWPAGNGASASLVAYQTGPVEEISRSTTSHGATSTTLGRAGAPPRSPTHQDRCGSRDRTASSGRTSGTATSGKNSVYRTSPAGSGSQ